MMKFCIMRKPRPATARLLGQQRGAFLGALLIVVGGAAAASLAGCNDVAAPAKRPPGARMGSPEEEAAKLATVQKAFEERQKMRAEKERKGQAAPAKQTPPGPKSPSTSPK